MKIISCTKPGDLELQDREPPVLKKKHSVVRIRRVGICGTDLHAFEGTQPYFDYPRTMGHELAATIEHTDPRSGFAKGEDVTVVPYFNCGFCVACRNNKPNCCVNLKVCGVHVDGGMAELLSVPDYSLMHNGGLTLDALALIEPLSIGAHAVRRAEIQSGESVLVVGAGPIGLGAMEFAILAGANVIGLDVNSQRLGFVKDHLGIENVIDGSNENVLEALARLTHNDMPAVVIDATGNRRAIEASIQYIRHGGRYVLVGLQKENICFSHPEFHKREATLMSSRNATRKDFEHVMDVIGKGLIKPEKYITHRVRFSDVPKTFSSLLDPANNVIKAMIEI